ncbi:hypothetical protein IAT38_002374 [Cryptococcus sp. DSM 104549]
MSHSSNSSLLHQNRPDSLLPQLHDPSVVVSQAQALWLEKHEQTQQQLCRSKGSDTAALITTSDAHSLVPGVTPSSHSSTSQMSIAFLEPVASTSSGLNYLNIEPTSGQSREHAVADVPSPMSETSDNIQSCANLLAQAQVTAIGEALSKDKWQPDASSALCTFPLCTANFAQTNYFFLGPRRHHCRLCGQLFCGAHSSQRAPLIHSIGGGAGASALGLGSRRVAHERVCDMCLPRPDAGEATPSLAGASSISSVGDVPHLRKNSASESEPFSDYSSNLVTPASDDCAFHHSFPSSSSLLPTSSRDRTALPTATLLPHSSPAEGPALAPIESWMDRSGVLSLYPLAVNPSHSRSKRSVSPAPSAGPLFAPSLKSRRAAAAKEAERQTLRQRRQAGADEFWLPGKWGYKREDFDPTWRQEDEEEGELEVVLGGGGVVEDGPIRFRSGRRITPVVTPAAKA